MLYADPFGSNSFIPSANGSNDPTTYTKSYGSVIDMIYDIYQKGNQIALMDEEISRWQRVIEEEKMKIASWKLQNEGG